MNQSTSTPVNAPTVGPVGRAGWAALTGTSGRRVLVNLAQAHFVTDPGPARRIYFAQSDDCDDYLDVRETLPQIADILDAAVPA